ncbi:MAG: hypothetical protein H6727_19670, partial [Myxococcales bacterium]|nr:hypothetical protein [Myxococcales bacterium]
PVTQRWSAFSENTPVMGGWVVQYDAFRDWLWFGLHDEDRINFYDFKNSRWRGLPCAEGQVRSLAVWRDRLFTIVGRHLYTTDDKMERGWKAFACGGYCASIVSNKDLQRPYLFLTGRRWYESHNGGFRWKDITPPPHLVTGRFKAHLGAQGRRYAFQGGLLNGTLVTAAPGQSFEKRPLPASDIRVLITDPQDDRQVWIGTWGQGVFYSPDTGKTWKDLKLQGVEVRYLVRFQDALYAGSSNLVFNKGLYRQKITPKTRPRQPSTRSVRPSRPAL